MRRIDAVELHDFQVNADERGHLVEVFREDWDFNEPDPEMMYYSMTYPGVVREWIYVKDNCRALDLVLREGDIGKIYNIGSHAEKTNLEVTEAILDAVGEDDDLIEFVEDRAGHDQCYALETEKIESLGWEPEYSFEEGLERTVEYYLD